MRRLAFALALLLPASLGAQSTAPLIDYSGLQGLLPPSYDRVDGLSLPIGAVITLGGGLVVIEPRVAYVSRLGTLDPRVDVSIAPDKAFGLDLNAGRSTRTNDAWIYGNLVNSVTSLFTGSDVRNYFRSSGGEGRVVGRDSTETFVFSAFVGARSEQVDPITAAGNVFSFHGRKSDEKGSRPNPLVESGRLNSGLFGAEFRDSAGVVRSRGSILVEKSFDTMTGTSAFTQLTVDGHVAFPTFGAQSMAFRGHLVATAGDRVPRARYAYLGGSGTLPVLELLEQGGDELLFVESRYLYPLGAVTLPMVGHPVLTLKHIMGAAGVGSLPNLEQELGLGLGLSALRIDLTTDVAHHRGSKLGLGISFGH